MFRLFLTFAVIIGVLKCIVAAEEQIECGENEVLSTCINRETEYTSCSEIGTTKECVMVDPKFCEKGCKCKATYLKSDDGVCIPASECPNALKCTKENEYYDLCPSECSIRVCGVTDNLHCPDFLPLGSPKCPSPDCMCKVGFYRNNEGECVLWDMCPKVNSIVCGDNEIYNSCANNGCPRQYCSQPEGLLCLNLVAEDCKEGCHCKEGYLRIDNGTCVLADQCSSVTVNERMENFENAIVDFTTKCLYETAIANSDASVTLSPYSILSLLTQLFLFVTGKSSEKLLSVFKTNHKYEQWPIIPYYLSPHYSQSNVICDRAEKVFANSRYIFSTNFTEVTKNVCQSEAINLDFCRNINAASTINSWAATNTHYNILNLVSPDSLDCTTGLVLVDAVYFTGNWKNQFDFTKTTPTNFYVNSEKSVEVNMMKRTGSYQYAKVTELDAQVILLPYEDEQFSFMIWLPNSKDGIDALLSKIQNYVKRTVLTNVLQSLKEKTIDLSMPAFTTTTEIDIKQLLEKVNATEMFDATTSGLSGIFETPTSVPISKATLKATLVINESGSSSGLVTSVVSSLFSLLSLSKNTAFTADHQFVYFVLYNGTPILIGRFSG